jgi:hypothetical protein
MTQSNESVVGRQNGEMALCMNDENLRLLHNKGISVVVNRIRVLIFPFGGSKRHESTSKILYNLR